MSIKTIFKLFIPPIFFVLKNYFFKFFKNNKINNLSTIKYITKKSDKLIILGNGPSLNQSIDKYKDKLKKIDCLVVNHFCETEYYELLKPLNYLLIDPAFFGNLETYEEWLHDKISNFIKTLTTKTKWNLNLIVPVVAKDSYFISQVNKNSFIHIFYINNSDLVIPDKVKLFEQYDQNLISVPAQTCLNTCVYLGIYKRYNEIYIIGADTNWIEDIHVDQNTNEVYCYDKHFYGEKKKKLFSDIEGKIPSKLHEELYCQAIALESYIELEKYAHYANVKVYNSSEYSLIDAFERKKITD